MMNTGGLFLKAVDAGAMAKSLHAVVHSIIQRKGSVYDQAINSFFRFLSFSLSQSLTHSLTHTQSPPEL